MKIRKTAVVLAALAALGATGAALAGYSAVVHRHGGGPGRAFMGRLLDDPAVVEQLKLTPDQVTRLSAIRDQGRASIRPLRAATIRARADLRATMLDTNASRQDIEKSAAAVREAASAVSREMTTRLLDARDVLSVDQREELRSILRERAGTARRGFRQWRRPPRSSQGDTDEAAPEDGIPGASPEAF
jgi:Spy/CpxP family protein refolding chaperone